MAVKKFILSFGQSNSGPSPDLYGWLTKHPELNLRNTSTAASIGSYNDKFTMPGSFTGYTSLDLYGRAIQGIKYLTFYHPFATGYATYPGTGRVAANSPSSTLLYVDQCFVTGVLTSGSTGNQFNITRQSNGATYTVTNVQSFQGQVNFAGSNTATINWTGHNIIVGDQVAFYGTVPSSITAGVKYYVVASTAGTSFQISSTSGGTAITFATALSNVVTNVYLGGSDPSPASRITITPASGSPAFSSPLAGEQFKYEIRAFQGAGAGVTNRVYTNIRWGTFWIGDLNGLQINCYTGPSQTSQNHATSKIISGVSPDGLYLTTSTAWNTDSHQGDYFTITEPRTITSWTTPPTENLKKWAYFLPWTFYEGFTTVDQFGQSMRPNPYPKGFDYPNHWNILPFYLPFSTTVAGASQGVGYHVGLAASVQDALGEDVYVITSDFGGSALAHTELPAGSGEYGWHDPKQQGSWSPSMQNGCFNRLMDQLDAAITAAAVEGNTLQCVGIFFAQGETDASFPKLADRYAYNLKSFKARIRQELKNRGMWTASADTMPWVQPKINPDYWPYASTVNAAIERVAQDDRYMRTFDVSDIPRKPDDPPHYSGLGAVMLEERAYAAWQNIRASESASTQGVLDICNLALSHIGDTAKITSIDPPDGSTQAALCARFYPIARNSLLEMKYWSFATRRVALTAIENTWPEWDYCYMVPPGVASIFAVLPAEATDDYSTRFSPTDSPGYFANNIPIIAAGRYAPQPFQVEVNTDGDQIILTDQADAVLRYCSLVTEPNHFTPLFSMALSWHLASMLAGPILKGDVGSAEAKRCQQMMAAYLSKAETSDSSQRNIKPEHIVSWMSGR